MNLMKMMSLSLGMILILMSKISIVLTSSSPTRDSPKKPRAKEPSTPSKSSARQHLFDAAVYVSASISSLGSDFCLLVPRQEPR